MKLQPEQKLQETSAAILKSLANKDASHMEIVARTSECHSSVSLSLKQLHAAGKIHIAAYVLKQYRHIKVYRLGPGADAEKVGTASVMRERSAAVLDLLRHGDLTRSAIATRLKCSSSTTFNVISYMRENGLIHVTSMVTEASRYKVHLYRAGPGEDALETIAKKPKDAKSAKVKVPRPPPIDPLMAALFGR